MPEPARAPAHDPPVDPYAVDRAFVLHRARRRARIERRRAERLAKLRFWLVVVALLALTVFLSVTVWREIQRLFGL